MNQAGRDEQAQETFRRNRALLQMLVGADVFIGVLRLEQLLTEMVKTMNVKDAIILHAQTRYRDLPDDAKAGGAKVIPQKKRLRRTRA